MTQNKKTILFLCTGNSCRSQIAEGLARSILPSNWKIYSAGIFAIGVNQTAIEVMNEIGIDISDQYSKMLDKIPIDNMDYVITLCGNAKENCPVFPKKIATEHWPIEDPISSAEGNIKDRFRKTRDEIKKRIEGFIQKDR